MTQSIESDLLTKSLLGFLKETCEQVEGIYLDQRASFGETLVTISAEEASRPFVPGGSTIAAHVAHVCFYLDVIQDYMRGQWNENVDWKKSWQTTTVSDEQWTNLRQQLKGTYQGLVNHVGSAADWNSDQRLGGAIAAIVHTAYHLGAVRQMMLVLKR